MRLRRRSVPLRLRLIAPGSAEEVSLVLGNHSGYTHHSHDEEDGEEDDRDDEDWHVAPRHDCGRR